MQGCLDRVREAALYAFPDHQPVDDYLYVVLVVLVQPEVDGQLVQLTVDPHAGVAALGQLFEHPPVLALAPPHHRREHHKARLLGEGKHLLDHLLRRRRRHGEAADVTVRPSCARVEQAQVIVDLRYRGDRGAGVVGRGLLVDGDRRREAVDVVGIGLIHLAEELPGVGGEALHVAALPLRVDGVECKRRLPATGEPGHHHHHVPRHGDRYVLEVVFARPPHDDLVFRDLFSPLFFGTPQASIRPPVGRPKKQFAFGHILAPQRPISVVAFAIFCPWAQNNRRRLHPVANGARSDLEGLLPDPSTRVGRGLPTAWRCRKAGARAGRRRAGQRLDLSRRSGGNGPPDPGRVFHAGGRFHRFTCRRLAAGRRGAGGIARAGRRTRGWPFRAHPGCAPQAALRDLLPGRRATAALPRRRPNALGERRRRDHGRRAGRQDLSDARTPRGRGGPCGAPDRRFRGHRSRPATRDAGRAGSSRLEECERRRDTSGAPRPLRQATRWVPVRTYRALADR